PATLALSTVNAQGAKIILPVFLCPSDVGTVVSPGFGPTNYAACAGTGLIGTCSYDNSPPNNCLGSPMSTDGIFYVNSRTNRARIADGSSHTALFCESVLGTPTGT